ncbi:MAG: pyridoxamine 5'-phosphate oxidase family protein [Caldilineaceae bacterium]|nr:pyridoxamine 5'-phosphate oxidase family protein [Caldilineaceae bacterium]
MGIMEVFDKTDLNRVRRLPARGQYDRATIDAIVDEALICHVAFAVDGQPFVIPTIHARMGDEIVLHGAPASRLLKHIVAGNPIAIAVTLVDGLVLARSVFHSSMNYRSAVLFGHGRILDGDDEKLAALEAITEHLARGRWIDARRPTQQELDATIVVAVAIDSASAKVRTGPPGDDEDDYALPIWAGVLPFQLQPQTPVPDPRLADDIAIPTYVTNYVR